MLTFDAAPDELQLFLQEADEQLQLLDQDIVLLEKEGTRPELLQEIFRAAHTLKGSSAAIGHKKMASLTHAMEGVLDSLRHGTLCSSTGLIDVMLQSLDGLRLLKEEVVTFQDCGFDPDELVQRLAGIGSQASRPQEAAEPAKAAETKIVVEGTAGILVEVELADDCALPSARCLQVYLEASRFGNVAGCTPSLEAIESLQAGHRVTLVVDADGRLEAMASAIRALPDVSNVSVGAELARAEDAAAAHPGAESERLPGSEAMRSPAQGAGKGPSPAGGSLGKTVRLDVSRLDDLMNLVGELVIDRTRLAQIGNHLQARYEDDSVRDLGETSQHISRIIDELQESIMKARMLPVDSLFNRLPRVVRDLAQRAGKQIDFVIEGRETELDRSVIEELHDPLVHLLRNAVDHGVEAPELRAQDGKPDAARIKLSATHMENRILIRVEDDGAGIDPGRIKAVALDRGVISPDVADRLSDQEAVDLIFLPGFSTAKTVSDVSGRGVGMDIVKTNIEKLNGSVRVESQPGQGTRFTLELPLTLAIIDALMVGLGSEVLAVPLVSVVETLRVRRSEIHYINNREVIQLRNGVLPLLKLEDALGLPPSGMEEERVFVVAVRVGDHRMGLVVDSLVGQLQVVIKSLGRQVGNIPGVTGATILGDGRVALILDVPSLVKYVLDEQQRGWAA